MEDSEWYHALCTLSANFNCTARGRESCFPISPPGSLHLPLRHSGTVAVASHSSVRQYVASQTSDAVPGQGVDEPAAAGGSAYRLNPKSPDPSIQEGGPGEPG